MNESTSGQELQTIVGETIKVDDRKIRPALKPVNGLVAIFDALGAKNYSEEEIFRFLDSRDVVLENLAERARAGKIDQARLQFFTFGDTIVIVYRAVSDVSFSDLFEFGLRMRAFMLHSLTNQILFRGAISIGRLFVVDDKTNTVMGPAVSDAADWYDKADWIGIQTTPHATMYIDAKLSRLGRKLHQTFVPYDVPMKTGGTLRVLAINWPRAFFVRGLRPSRKYSGRAMLLSNLAGHAAPRGTEAKYFNAIAYFDHVVMTQELPRPRKRRDKLTPTD